MSPFLTKAYENRLAEKEDRFYRREKEKLLRHMEYVRWERWSISGDVTLT